MDKKDRILQAKYCGAYEFLPSDLHFNGNHAEIRFHGKYGAAFVLNYKTGDY